MTHPRSPKRRTRLTAALLAATIASTGLVSLVPSAALAVPAGDRTIQPGRCFGRGHSQRRAGRCFKLNA